MNAKLGILAVLLLAFASVANATAHLVFLDSEQTAQWYVWQDGIAHYIGPAIAGWVDSGYVPYIPYTPAIPQTCRLPNCYSSLG